MFTQGSTAEKEIDRSIIFSKMNMLVLDDCQLDDTGAKNLSFHLKNSTSIKKIIVSNNPLSDQGIKDLGKAFGEMRTLQELRISYNTHITDEGYKDLFLSLKKSYSLRFLNLTGSSFGVQAGDALIDLLNEKTDLTLDMSFNLLKEGYFDILIGKPVS